MKDNLEIYVHIPFCVKKCGYCDFLSFVGDEREQSQYVEALVREIRYYGALMKGREVSTIYIGGGTPSWLEAGLLIWILDELRQNFQVAADAEISMESNPGTITADKMKEYKRAGINRLSIGLQSTDDRELKLLGRIHTYDQFLRTYEMARNAGFDNINVDLISGLPEQTAEKFAQTLSRVIRLKPEHISAYTLIIEKGTPFYDKYKFDAVKQHAGMPTEILPDEDEAYRIYKMTQKMLTSAGYDQYEVSNYAKKGCACKHNLGYWSRENYLGMGLGASSLLDQIRYRNMTNLYSYIEETKEITTKELDGVLGLSIHESGELLSHNAQMEEFMFLGLRKKEGIRRSDFEACFGMTVESVFRDAIEQLKEEGLLETMSGMIRLTDRGMDLSNYAMAKFLLDS